MKEYSFIITGHDTCPYIPINNFDNIEEYMKSLGKNLRKDINRRSRRLDELGVISYSTYSSNETEEAIGILPMMLHFHALRWPKAYKAPNLHHNIVKYGLASSILHFNQLNVDGKPISWQISFVFNNTMYFYMPTINPNYHTCSPGKVLLLNCIEQAINMDLKICDLMRGAEEYKSEWTDNYQTIFNISFYSNSFITKLKRTLMKLRRLVA